MNIWVVGQVLSKDEAKWAIEGVYSNMADAEKACLNDRFFVGPMEMDKPFKPGIVTVWEEGWYPILEGFRSKRRNNMPKRWNGTMPFNNKLRDGVTEDSKEELKREFQAGYRLAMNSPEVKGLYEALKQVRKANLSREDWQALTAYEAGLKEAP